MSALSRSLVTPQKLASVLDWTRKAVMALDIAENHVGICVGGHPSSSSSSSTSRHGGDAAIRRLDPIRLRAGSSSSRESAAERIDELAREHNVCAVVVGWPLQPEGNPGKPCGKVLYTLETLLESSGEKSGGGGIVSRRRPFTLWDDRHVPIASSSPEKENEVRAAARSFGVETDQPPDQWGRCVAFARAPTSKEGETYRSRHAYARPTVGEDGSERASSILEHFLGSVFDQGETASKGGGGGTTEMDYRKVTNDSWEEDQTLL